MPTPSKVLRLSNYSHVQKYDINSSMKVTFTMPSPRPSKSFNRSTGRNRLEPFTQPTSVSILSFRSFSIHHPMSYVASLATCDRRLVRNHRTDLRPTAMPAAAEDVMAVQAHVAWQQYASQRGYTGFWFCRSSRPQCSTAPSPRQQNVHLVCDAMR